MRAITVEPRYTTLRAAEQVRSLFDLDCWDKDRPNLDKMREWIEALTEAGRQRFSRTR